MPATTEAEPSGSATPQEDSPPEGADILAPGKGLELVGSVPNPLPSGERWGLVGTTPDGQIIAGVWLADDQTRPATIDPATAAVTWIGEASEGAVFAADSDARHIVWLETFSKDLFTLPWVLHSYDRRTGQTMTVAEAPDVGVDPVPAAPDGSTPSIAGDRVWLAAVEKMDGQRPVPAIFSASLTSRTPLRREIAGAFDPKVAGNKVFYVRADTGTFQNWRVRSRDLKTGKETVVAKGGPNSRFSGISADTGALMWQEGKRDLCTVRLRTAGGTVVPLSSGNCDRNFGYYPQATSRYVSYSYSSLSVGYKAYVYDLRKATLRRLTRERLLQSPQGSGEYLAWKPVTGPDKDRVLVARLTRTD